MVDGDIKGVGIRKLNWDRECRLDFLTGKGFRIFQPTFTDKHREKKSLYGIQSEIFGSEWEDDDAFMDRYTCRCKTIKGKAFEGETCKICGSKIEFRDVDLEMTGWVILDRHHIIQPIFYRMLDYVMSERGNDTLTYMLEPIMTVDKEGIFIEDEIPEGIDPKKNPFIGIGIDGLKERFREIMEYYYEVKPKRRDVIDVLLKSEDDVFASSIPVYSSALRPIGFGGKDGYFFTAVDKKYPVIITKARGLNRKPLKSKKSYSVKRRQIHDRKKLFELQKTIMEIWEMTFSTVETKYGHIRQNIIGGRMNFSARSVIVPNPDLRADEIILSYPTVLELFRYQIIGQLVRVTGMTYQQAAEEASRSETAYNPRIYELMLYIIHKLKPQVIINRNPTIRVGSLITMNIKGVRKEIDGDYTMEVPIAPISDMNADFDGDEINILALLLKSKEFDRSYNPRKSLFISRNDGMFNNNTNLVKDQMVGLHQFNNI